MFIDFEWGEAALSFNAGVNVIVDVLSFSTTCNVAVEQGYTIYPFPDRRGAAAYGAALGIKVAGRRSQEASQPTLSPESFRDGFPPCKLILPSPNGSRLSSFARAETVLAGCLRNAKAVADAVAAIGQDSVIVAAGEHWPNGRLRFAVEDYLGAGAILANLKAAKSAEAQLCESAYLSCEERLSEILHHCRSGAELRDIGFDNDVNIACALSQSHVVPIMRRGQRSYREVLATDTLLDEAHLDQPVNWYEPLGN